MAWIAFIVLIVVAVTLAWAVSGRYEPPIYVGPSHLGGRGVFAGRRFLPGEVIETCPTITDHGDRWGDATSDYVFGGSHRPQNSVLVLGYGSLYQHSDDSNAEHELIERDNVMVYTAKRTIEKHQPITVDYGEEWWTSRNYTKKT